MSKREQIAELMNAQVGRRIEALNKAGKFVEASALEKQLIKTLFALEK